MQIIALNIRHGGGKRVPEILNALASTPSDIIVLTEFRENSNAVTIRKSLLDKGYRWQACSSSDPKLNAVFLAARIPFEMQQLSPTLAAHSHRLLLARFSGFDIVGCYFPQNQAKQLLFDYLIDKCPLQTSDQMMIIGDMNTGQHLIDEKGKTFYCADSFDQLSKSGLVDSWRTRHQDEREFSWFSNAGNGFRIDHAFCTPKFDERVTSAKYLHQMRTPDITDHSALVVCFEL